MIGREKSLNFMVLNITKSVNKNTDDKSFKAGYLIIEMMIGISIAVVGLLGILTLLSRSMSLNRVLSEQFIASYLAAEGIEITKNLIDANIIQSNPWNEGFTNGSFEADYTSLSLASNQNQPILFDSANNFYSYQSGNPTPFTRIINIEFINIELIGSPLIGSPFIGSEEMKVNSIVRWTTRGGGKFEVNLEDHFLNWRP